MKRAPQLNIACQTQGRELRASRFEVNSKWSDCIQLLINEGCSCHQPFVMLDVQARRKLARFLLAGLPTSENLRPRR